MAVGGDGRVNAATNPEGKVYVIDKAGKSSVFFDPAERYIWARANLHNRVMARAAKSAATRHFTVPPKELMFISRKFVGAYTFMTVIDAQIHSRQMLAGFLDRN